MLESAGPVVRKCKGCGTAITVYNSIRSRCRSSKIARAMQIPQQGKQARLWTTFRDEVARAFLGKNFGYVCSREGCSVTTNLDVDDIQKRGFHPELKFVASNLRYLCRTHHIEETDQLR
ncbi:MULTISPECIES: hypothetical protein [unclassified Rathayibacter]|uniref:hypothetical protein n=1 Tax=unclassified Rathayibacter TaxID=2609250 RepID=UPI0010629FDE|nr:MULTISPECIES: hypothetical protein [unclassified Rathayibacter]